MVELFLSQDMKTIEVVVAVIRKGDQILATQRGYSDWKGWWEYREKKSKLEKARRKHLHVRSTRSDQSNWRNSE